MAPIMIMSRGTKQTCFWFIILTFSVNSTRHEDCKTEEYLHEREKYSRNERDTKTLPETSSETPCQLSSSSKNANHEGQEEEGIDNNSRANQRLPLVATFSDWHFDERQLLIETFPLDHVKENYVRQVRNAVFSKVFPIPTKTKTHLIAVSEEVASAILDLDRAACNSEFFTAFVSGNTFLPDSVPLSHRYGGHQFGSWSGQLGDGRAVMLGEYVNSKGERWELQLKGSGLTPYSRRGDGRAVLRSSIREFLCSEAMYHLGIPTSRALSLSVSSDPVWRDQFYDGHPKQEKAAVVMRLAPSWFRIGSLEILAMNKEIPLLRKLIDFVIENYFPQVEMSDDDRYLAFFAEVVSETAGMISKWMSVGFAHGVMNTDNFSLLSQTIDYGPFGFLDSYLPEFVPNTSDDEALYSYERQPDVGYFNLNKLRISLLPLVTKQQASQLFDILEGYVGIYKTRFMGVFRKKLGLFGIEEVDEYIIGFLLKLMQDTRADFTMTFHQLGALSLDKLSKNEIPDSLWALKDLQQHERFSDWTQDYNARAGTVGGEVGLMNRKELMNAVNPRYILRNWMAQEAIERAEEGDYSKIHLLQTVLQTPYKVQEEAERALYAQRPPQWANKIRVSCSS